MSIAHIKLSQQAKEQLIKLKRVTGIKHWNALCRWAFCTSLAEQTSPSVVKIPADSSVEMDWKTFGGEYADLYLLLLKQRLLRDGLPLTDDSIATQFRLHLHRGIGYLFADRKLKDIGDLFRRIPALSA